MDKKAHMPLRCLIFLFLGLSLSPAWAAEPDAVDPLPAWTAGANKQAIVAFVERVTRPNSPDFVPVPERIAVFDHDGTLWVEQPIYPQFVFVLERLRALAPRFPGWPSKQPFKAALEGNYASLAAQGPIALQQLTIATHSGLTTDQFDAAVKDWLAHASHPRFGRPYSELAYQPMLELLAYLERHEFKNWIVSGGSADFIRVWSERVYRIPPERVIGSSVKLKFEMADGKSLLVRLPEIDFINSHAAKPVGIQQQIGRRPLMTFGNADGDLQMLQWTSGGSGPRFVGLIRHTDAAREYAYDREASVGHLELALDEAKRRRWPVVSIRDDWAKVFAFDR
ncbi:HAD family hydrolase [Methylotetracoccus oryzae]|uniref:HAD family hydrolase n=1 Tax=Methylotetracoccus oryzae TaxID=1919059 RepID=UPI00111A25A4|nr:HAD family hydrolase [Methylotetracoccus oryzae]